MTTLELAAKIVEAVLDEAGMRVCDPRHQRLLSARVLRTLHEHGSWFCRLTEDADAATIEAPYELSVRRESVPEYRDRFSIDLHFGSLQEFATFIAIIRGETLDDQKLAEMTAALRKSTNAVQAAVDAAKKGT